MTITTIAQTPEDSLKSNQTETLHVWSASATVNMDELETNPNVPLHGRDLTCNTISWLEVIWQSRPGSTLY